MPQTYDESLFANRYSTVVNMFTGFAVKSIPRLKNIPRRPLKVGSGEYYLQSSAVR